MNRVTISRLEASVQVVPPEEDPEEEGLDAGAQPASNARAARATNVFMLRTTFDARLTCRCQPG